MDRLHRFLYRFHRALHEHDHIQNHKVRYHLYVKYQIEQELSQPDHDLYQGKIQSLHRLPCRLLQPLIQVLLIEARWHLISHQHRYLSSQKLERIAHHHRIFQKSLRVEVILALRGLDLLLVYQFCSPQPLKAHPLLSRVESLQWFEASHHHLQQQQERRYPLLSHHVHALR